MGTGIDKEREMCRTSHFNSIWLCISLNRESLWMKLCLKRCGNERFYILKCCQFSIGFFANLKYWFCIG